MKRTVGIICVVLLIMSCQNQGSQKSAQLQRSTQLSEANALIQLVDTPR